MHPEVDQETCNSWGTCIDICPSEVYQWIDERPEATDPEECIECGACEDQCPAHAIVMADD
ncbi:MAG: ferredoxin family protein [Thermodesulfobacteriota bacterium]